MKYKFTQYLLSIGLLLCGLYGTPATAFNPPPLIISGLSEAGDPVEVTLSRDELAAFPQESVSTPMPWVNGIPEFRGVNLYSLLTHYRIQPGKIYLSALNRFSAELDWQDIKQYQPILAIQRNGEWMQVRDYGPYWLIFAINRHPELINQGFLEKMVWQLHEINVVP
ncbi:oxidoreductase [Photobacterium sp. GJ3]|uniref:oxidoreductase n=1 Tax=Photobacterium sp. GJ3 TaxID=2829502 RepID=UPI001B8BCCDD|nr:oxidoreductase [Photobacterium sp. GJ3]QUJ66387.1 oxidoreductase [Photobacterium sp. GJ3]